MSKKIGRKVGRPKRKSIRDPKDPQPGPKRTRIRYGVGIKRKVVALHKEGMSLKQIDQWLIDNEKMKVKKTLFVRGTILQIQVEWRRSVTWVLIIMTPASASKGHVS